MISLNSHKEAPQLIEAIPLCSQYWWYFWHIGSAFIALLFWGKESESEAYLGYSQMMLTPISANDADIVQWCWHLLHRISDMKADVGKDKMKPLTFGFRSESASVGNRYRTSFLTPDLDLHATKGHGTIPLYLYLHLSFWKMCLHLPLMYFTFKILCDDIYHHWHRQTQFPIAGFKAQV